MRTTNANSDIAGNANHHDGVAARRRRRARGTAPAPGPAVRVAGGESWSLGGAVTASPGPGEVFETIHSDGRQGPLARRSATPLEPHAGGPVDRRASWATFPKSCGRL